LEEEGNNRLELIPCDGIDPPIPVLLLPLLLLLLLLLLLMLMLLLLLPLTPSSGAHEKNI